ncbi:MAG: 16S rRNA (cytidine(1402)-2'-O)-methyltransferase [Actinomycetota bacterium]
MTGRLFICGTPIGNLGDASHRLLRVLGEVDVVAAEDTRRTRKLLTHYGIHARLVSYHGADERAGAQRLLERLRRGDRVALVSDSGMPGVSDPGYEIVRRCIEEAIPVEAVPGPSAVVTALCLSGLPMARFAFEGFLPRRDGERRRRLEALSCDDRTLVIFEAPGRLPETLAAIEEVLGDRRLALARELTKVHEEVIRGTVSEVLAGIEDRELKGEIVLVVEGRCRGAGNLEAALRNARALREAGQSPSRAAAAAAATFRVPRRAVYQALLDGSVEGPSPDEISPA